MRTPLPALGLVALAACTPASDAPFSAVIAPFSAPEVSVSRGIGPPDADPDACYGHQVTPAVIETITDQVMIQPPQIASDGSVLEPGIYVTETQQRIVEERRELWFETPCAAETDPAFIASLQRALAARGLYRGAPTGVMDRRTRRAIRDYQAPQGLDSAVLSLAAAQQLGLALWDPDLAAGGTGG